jgi:hypothetical protein
MKIKMKNVGTVTINGCSYHGRNIEIDPLKNIIIDGVKQRQPAEIHNSIKVLGNIDSLQVENGNVVAESAGKITMNSGNINCLKVKGNIETVSGDVFCEKIDGDVSSITGDIQID